MLGLQNLHILPLKVCILWSPYFPTLSLWQLPFYSLLLWVWLGFFFKIPHKIEIMGYLLFCVWLILFNIMSSRFICCSKWQGFLFFFFFGWTIFHYLHIPHLLYPFIHSCVDGHLSCFHMLANVNNAAVNIVAHVSFQISVFVFFGYVPRNGIAG